MDTVVAPYLCTRDVCSLELFAKRYFWRTASGVA